MAARLASLQARVVLKPFNIDELLTVLAEVLAARHAETGLVPLANPAETGLGPGDIRIVRFASEEADAAPLLTLAATIDVPA